MSKGKPDGFAIELKLLAYRKTPKTGAIFALLQQAYEGGLLDEEGTRELFKSLRSVIQASRQEQAAREATK